ALHLLAVEAGHQRQLTRIRNLVRGGHAGTKAARTLEILACEQAVLLIVAERSVVEERISGHVVQRLLARDMPTRLTDHHGQFAFVIEMIGRFWPDDWRLMRDDGGVMLEEDTWIFRKLAADLFGMVAIVAPNAHDLVGIRQHRKPGD